MPSVDIDCKTERTALIDKTIDILTRVVSERGDDVDTSITLTIDRGIGPDGYRIADAGGAIEIAGGDPRGVLYGVGKFLRNRSWRGTSVPAKPVRAMYFASHFFNFYHDAPVEKVQRYVEELALWGCNALSVWFDMHHFNGIDDPDAREMIARLRAVLEAANAVGISAGLTTLANEAYANSPEHLRADWTAGHDGYTSPPGGHYHVEICPHKPGGLEQITTDRRKMLLAFADLDIEYVWIWPYDQGGCTCSECAPWGAGGFLKTARAEADVIREVMPTAKIVLSTWYFDHFTTGEWEGLAEAFSAEKPDWVDYLMIDDYGTFPEYPLTHGVPGGFPVVNFPEISMEGMGPWGGYGANPRPARWQAHWDKTRDLVSGSFPYSEGIYEDLNKVIMLQLEWSPDRTATDIVREYAAGEFSHEVADDVVTLTQRLEAAQGHSAESNAGAADGKPVTVLHHLGGVTPEAAAETLELARAIDAKLSARAKAAWRWRVLYIRAALDAELTASGGEPTDAAEAYFDELTAIYHADRGLRHVSPPSRKAWQRIDRTGIQQT